MRRSRRGRRRRCAARRGAGRGLQRAYETVSRALEDGRNAAPRPANHPHEVSTSFAGLQLGRQQTPSFCYRGAHRTSRRRPQSCTPIPNLLLSPGHPVPRRRKGELQRTSNDLLIDPPTLRRSLRSLRSALLDSPRLPLPSFLFSSCSVRRAGAHRRRVVSEWRLLCHRCAAGRDGLREGVR